MLLIAEFSEFYLCLAAFRLARFIVTGIAVVKHKVRAYHKKIEYVEAKHVPLGREGSHISIVNEL